MPYKSQFNDIRQLHHELKQIADELEVARDNPLLNDVEEPTQSDINILVLGEYGLDKILLVEQLLGKELKIEGSNPSDKYPIFIRHGNKPKATVDVGGHIKEFGFEKTGSVYISLNKIVSSEINHIELRLPDKLLLNHHNMIVLPGLGGINPAHRLLLKQHIYSSSGAVLIVDLQYGLTQVDQEVLSGYLTVLPTVFLCLLLNENNSTQENIKLIRSLQSSIREFTSNLKIEYFVFSSKSIKNYDVGSVTELSQKITNVKFSPTGFLQDAIEQLTQLYALCCQVVENYKLLIKKTEAIELQGYDERRDKVNRLNRVVSDQIQDITTGYEQALAAIKFKFFSSSTGYRGTFSQQCELASGDINQAKDDMIRRIDDLEEMISHRMVVSVDNVSDLKKLLNPATTHKTNYFTVKNNLFSQLLQRLSFSLAISGVVVFLTFLITTPSLASPILPLPLTLIVIAGFTAFLIAWAFSNWILFRRQHSINISTIIDGLIKTSQICLQTYLSSLLKLINLEKVGNSEQMPNGENEQLTKSKLLELEVRLSGINNRIHQLRNSIRS